MSPLWFPRGEYQARLEKLRSLLDQRNIDGLLVSWDTNIRYYTGFRHTTAHISQARVNTALLTRVGDPVLFVHVFLALDARVSAWFKDVRSFNQLFGPPIDDIAAEIRARAIRTLAAELGPETRLGMPMNDFLAIRERVPGIEWVDGSGIIWEQRMRKSPAELNCVRKAGYATARGYEVGLPQVRAGMTEREVARLLQRAMFEAGAEQIAFILVTSGEGNYGRISGAGTDRRVQKGEMVWVDMGARYNDYCADFTRAGVIGGPTDQQKRRQELVNAATEAGIRAAGPGVPVAEVANACQKEIKRRAAEITFVAGRIGHGVGMNITEPPHVATYDPTVLEPGMVITVEPGIVERYGTFHVEQNLIITEQGVEITSVAPRDLWSL
jgi:Xaa-Pro aminopeptidase